MCPGTEVTAPVSNSKQPTFAISTSKKWAPARTQASTPPTPPAPLQPPRVFPRFHSTDPSEQLPVPARFELMML